MDVRGGGMTTRGTPRKFDYDQMGRDFDAGMTKAEIARKHGCSHFQATQAVARRAIPNSPAQDEMSATLTDVFRKHMGYCPMMDDRPGSEATS